MTAREARIKNDGLAGEARGRLFSSPEGTGLSLSVFEGEGNRSDDG